MENTFRRAILGGFNRKDVTEYISRMAEDYSRRLEELEKGNENLRIQLADQAELTQQVEALRRDLENTAQELEEERTAKMQYQHQLEESISKIEKMGVFQQEAEEYSGVKEHIANIELEARRRADAMLAEAKNQSDALLLETERKVKELHRSAADEFQELYDQYQRLTGIFQTASTHVTEELRQMEVAVGQLPLAFDKARAKLEKLKEQV